MAHDFIRLDDLLHRDVAVQWFEGVALVQAISTGLQDAGIQSFPNESDVALTSDGSVGLLGTGGTHDAVPAAGRLLARMLAEDVPVRLRLVVTEATAATVYPTLRDFSAALEYFERPDRAAILQELYARASRAEIRTDLPRVAPPLPDASSAAQLETKHRITKKQSPALVAMTAAGVTMCAVITWAAFRMPDGTVSSALESAKEVVRTSFGTDPVVDATPVEAENSKPSVQRTARPRTARAAATPPTTLALLPATPLLEGRMLSRLTPFTPERENVFFSSVDVIAMSVEELESAQRHIYSSSDPGVVPPHAVYPKLPASPPPALAREDQTVLDMVIGTDGLVETVRLRTSPRNVHEFMLLSAAKAWQFEPAFHPDGYPVRFKHSIVLSSLP